jgi:hypothetical protein
MDLTDMGWEGVDWMHLALVAMNFRVPLKAGSFLSS